MAVQGDPYVVLNVDREATDAEMKWAYERELKKAHRMDAFKHAQDIDAAYSILRDPQRRAMFDSHGITDPAVRDSPHERSGQADPTTFRTWPSPSMSGTTRATRSTAGGHSRRVKIYAGVAVLAVAIGAGAWLQSDLSSSTTGAVAPHTKSGRVDMVCTVGAGARPVEVTVRSGQHVSCADGATPRFRTVAGHHRL